MSLDKELNTIPNASAQAKVIDENARAWLTEHDPDKKGTRPPYEGLLAVAKGLRVTIDDGPASAGFALLYAKAWRRYMGREGNPRGFAAMDPKAHRELARRGGLAAQANGNGHRFTADEARTAGKIGGRKVSQDRARMAEIGRLGGLARGRKARATEGGGS